MTARAIPKPTATQKALAEVGRLAKELQACDLEAAKARQRLNAAILAAVKVAPQAEVARHAGVSKQRVGQLLKGAS